MNKKQRRSLVLSAVAAMGMGVAVVAGGTYALFTSESETNIAITAGKVDVKATIEGLKTYSGVELTGDPATDVVKETTVLGTFTNGGTATIIGNTLTLDKMTPGDKVEFQIRITNESDVAAMYRTILSATDEGLFDGLEIKIDDVLLRSLSKRTTYQAIEVDSADKLLSVSVSLPSDATDLYQGTKCEIVFAVEAIQGNSFNGVYNVTPATVQAALDKANDGDTIILGEGDYGTLYFRQSVRSEPYATGAAGGGAITVNGEKITYGYHQGRTDVTYMRSLKDITIIGSENAKVDNIEIMDAMYAYAEDSETTTSGNIIYNEENTNPYENDSASANMLYSFFTIENLTIQDVDFTGEKTAFEKAYYTRDGALGNESYFRFPTTIDGLRFDGCTMTVPTHEGSDIMLLDLYKDSGPYQYKNITIENCEIEADRVIRADGIENLTIRDNLFKNIKSRDINISQGGGMQDVIGKLVISGNTSDGGTERFIRIANAGEIDLYLVNNTISNYKGADTDYIKFGTAPKSMVVEGNVATAADGRTLTINIPSVS